MRCDGMIYNDDDDDVVDDGDDDGAREKANLINPTLPPFTGQPPGDLWLWGGGAEAETEDNLSPRLLILPHTTTVKQAYSLHMPGKISVAWILTELPVYSVCCLRSNPNILKSIGQAQPAHRIS